MRISVLTPTIRDEEALTRPRESLARQGFKDFEWLIERHDPTEPPDFNAAMNRMLRKARGELIVILQDYIKIPSNGLDAFYKAYTKKPNVFWTAPVGQTKDDRDIKWDWRTEREECNWVEWEIDWGAAPKDALFRVGGFDEALDKFWGFDNVNVGLRAEMMGYEFACLPDNRAVAYDHHDQEHPYMKLRNADYHNMRLDEFRRGLTINYLCTDSLNN